MSQQQQWFLGGKASSCGTPAGNGLSSRQPGSGQLHGSLPLRSLGYSIPGAVNPLATSFKPFSQFKTDSQSQSQPQSQQATSARTQHQHQQQQVNQSQLQAGGGPCYQSYSQTQGMSQSPNVSASRPSMNPKGISWSQQDMILGQSNARPGPGSAPIGTTKQPGASSYLQNSCVIRSNNASSEPGSQMQTSQPSSQVTSNGTLLTSSSPRLQGPGLQAQTGGSASLTAQGQTHGLAHALESRQMAGLAEDVQAAIQACRRDSQLLMQSVIEMGSSNTAQDLRTQRMEGSIGSMQSMLQRLLKDTSDLTASHSSLLELSNATQRQEQQVQKMHIRDAGCQTQDTNVWQKAAFKLNSTQQHNHTEHAEIVWEQQQASTAAGSDCPARVLAYHIRHSSYHKRKRSVGRTWTTTQVTDRAATGLPREKQAEPQPGPSCFAVGDDETLPPNDTYLPEACAPCSEHATAAAGADHDSRPLVLLRTVVHEVIQEEEVEASEDGQDLYHTVLNGATGHQRAKYQSAADNKRAKKLPAHVLTAPSVVQTCQSTLTCCPQPLPTISIKAPDSSPGLAQQLPAVTSTLVSTVVPSHILAMNQRIDDKRDKAGSSTDAHGTLQIVGSRAAGHVLTRQDQASAREAGKKRAAAAYDFIDDDDDGQPCNVTMLISPPKHIRSPHLVSNTGRDTTATAFLGKQSNQSAYLVSVPSNTRPLPSSPTDKICSLFNQSSTVLWKANPACQKVPQQVLTAFGEAAQHHRLYVPTALAPEKHKRVTSHPFTGSTSPSFFNTTPSRKPELYTACQLTQNISQPTYTRALGTSTPSGKAAERTTQAPRLQVTPFTGLLRGQGLVPRAQAPQEKHQGESGQGGQHSKIPVPSGPAPVRPASKGAKPVQKKKQIVSKPQPDAAMCYIDQSEEAQGTDGWVQVGKGVVKEEDAIARAVAQRMKRHRERNRKTAQQRAE